MIRLAYKSKYNFNEVILLMVTDSKKWHCLAVKSLSSLFRGTTLNYNGDFYCLNCFHSYSTKNKLKKHETICNDHDYCYVEIPNENNKILKYNRGEKSMKGPYMIYADLECSPKKIHSCQNNPETSYIKKKRCIYFLVTPCLQIVHLTQQKINLIVTEANIVWEDFVRI